MNENKSMPPPLPSPTRPSNWKKTLLLIGLACLVVLALLALVGALLFGGCAYLISRGDFK